MEYLDLLMFAALMGCILLGFPVSFSIAGVAIIFGYIGWATDAMNIYAPLASRLGLSQIKWQLTMY